MISITEQLILLSLDEKKGKLLSPLSAIEFGITGSMLLELALAGKLRLEKDTLVILINEQPTGDLLLGKALKLILKSKKPQPLLKWMVNLTMQDSRVIESMYFQQMVQKGLLKRESRPVLVIFKRSCYYPAKLEIRDELLLNLKKVIHLQKPADPHAVYLLGFIDRCNLLKDWFPDEEIQLYGKNLKRIFAEYFQNRSGDGLANFFLTVLEMITLSQHSAGNLLFGYEDKRADTP